MLGVIFMHTASAPLRAGICGQWHIINGLTSLAFSAVPLFFMMSGYLMLSEDTGNGAYISKLFRSRLPRLLVPLILWTAVDILWKCHMQDSLTLYAILDRVKDSLSQCIRPHLWYVYMLSALYIVSPIFSGIKHLDRRARLFIAIVIGLCTLYTAVNALLVLFGSQSSRIHIYLFEKLLQWGGGGHILTLVLGYLLGTTKEKISNFILMPSIIGVFALITSATYVLTVRGGEYDALFQYQGSGFEVILAALIFVFFKQNADRESVRFQSVINSLAAMSFPIYLMHGLTLGVIFSTGIALKGVVDTFFVFAATALISFVVLKTVSTVKPICYLFTGMTYAQASSNCNWIYTFRRKKGD